METTDWIIVAAYLILSLYLGMRYRNQAGKSLGDFFLGGRSLPWYLAGVSMVATTFAADTPLWVSERISLYGISGNWIWWNMLIGGMLTTFFFAQYWRRANVITELELIELRYSGTPAQWLRGFKSVYMGLFLNTVIIGWVNAAMIMILKVYFDISDFDALIAVGGLMVMVAVYSSMSGLKGVVVTDSVQFIIAMTACIILAWLAVTSDEVGGIAGLKAKVPEWRLDFFPTINNDGTAGGAMKAFSLSLAAFLTYGLVQWWASWYPGAEPGGGGYVAQRIMGTKDEKNAVFATLFFQLAHYCLRPWPWIIVGLCALVLYPELAPEDAGLGFVMTMRDFLPVGLKGLLFVAFLSAYMSTISTQLNWGSSYLTNDLYKRFIKKENRFASPEIADKHYVSAGRLLTILIMILAFFATTQITYIDKAATFLIECGAGLGLVLILRWYWWRVNAWSEISAMIAPFLGYVFSNYVIGLQFPDNLLLTTGITTLSWVAITMITQPEKRETLEEFYRRIRPAGFWKPFQTGEKIKGDLRYRFICWISALVMTYCLLFFIGYFIFQEWLWAVLNFILALGGFLVLRKHVSKIEFFK